MGKGGSDDNKSAVLIVLCKVILNPIDLVGYLEGLAKTDWFLRGNGGKTSLCHILGSQRGCLWSKKAQCYSREVSTDV